MTSLTGQPPFHYSALQGQNDIRLLALQPGDQQEEIRISIFHASLEQDPVYEALSYTWGDPSDMALIRCNELGNCLSITKNCESALRRLRQKDQERILWIDAICIDQSNIPERGQQVQIMSKIYAQAIRVLAYLGEASEDSEIGMDFILEDAETFHSSRTNRPPVGLGPGVSSSPQQRAIDHILERPYFGRVWVLQEILLARSVEVILGNRSVSWSFLTVTAFYVDFNKQAHLMTQYYRDNSSAFLTLDMTGGKRPESLLGLLRGTRHCKATDPRDKVFALLGLSTEGSKQLLTPDYSLSIRETFIKVAKFFMRDKKLDILCHAQGTRSAHCLPSWVPDWSFPLPEDVLGHGKDIRLGHNTDIITRYKAGSSATSNFSVEEDSDALIAEGKMFDSVAEVGPVYEMGADDCSTCLKKWESMASFGRDENTAEEIFDVFMDTILAPAAKVFKRWYATWTRVALNQQPGNTDEISEAMMIQLEVNRTCNARVFFKTKKGYLGLGPAEVQKGNHVVVLFGGSVPFILSQNQDSYHLVGECYTRGIMDGEVLRDVNIESVMFRIL